MCKADVWNWRTWKRIEHGRKRCRTCGTSFRLSFYTDGTSCKTSTLKKDEFEFEGPERIFLQESYLGFTLSYLRQLRWQEGIFDSVNIDDVVPRGDTCYDASNSGFHTVFNAWNDDPEYDNIEISVSIVTDGN